MSTGLSSDYCNEDPKLGGLNNKHLLITVLGTAKSKEVAGAWRGPSPGLQMAAFSLCLPVVWRRVSSFSYLGTNSITGAPGSWPHLNLITSKSPGFKYHCIGAWGFNIRVWGRGPQHTNIQCIAAQLTFRAR